MDGHDMNEADAQIQRALDKLSPHRPTLSDFRHEAFLYMLAMHLLLSREETEAAALRYANHTIMQLDYDPNEDNTDLCGLIRMFGDRDCLMAKWLKYRAEDQQLWPGLNASVATLTAMLRHMTDTYARYYRGTKGAFKLLEQQLGITDRRYVALREMIERYDEPGLTELEDYQLVVRVLLGLKELNSQSILMHHLEDLMHVCTPESLMDPEPVERAPVQPRSLALVPNLPLHQPVPATAQQDGVFDSWPKTLGLMAGIWAVDKLLRKGI